MKTLYIADGELIKIEYAIDTHTHVCVCVCVCVYIYIHAVSYFRRRTNNDYSIAICGLLFVCMQRNASEEQSVRYRITSTIVDRFYLQY